MKPEQIAQWVINNRYPKSEKDKISDHEMYYAIIDMINKKPSEYILCAAIWYKEILLVKEIKQALPKNCDKGVVVLGHRHGQCMWTMGSLTGLRSVTNASDGVGEHVQGFLTNTNRFVDRQEALEIARQANQVLDENQVRTHIGLHSEDLY